MRSSLLCYLEVDPGDTSLYRMRACLMPYWAWAGCDSPLTGLDHNIGIASTIAFSRIQPSSTAMGETPHLHAANAHRYRVPRVFMAAVEQGSIATASRALQFRSTPLDYS